MAKNKEETSSALVPGALENLDLNFAELLGDGFSESRVIKIGGKAGQVGQYIGRIVGPGRDIEIKDDKTGEVSMLPTWQFKPVVATDGSVQENVTHVLPSPHVLNAEFGRIWDRCEREKVSCLVAVAYVGQVDTRRGFRVNDYRVAEKYVAQGA